MTWYLYLSISHHSMRTLYIQCRLVNVIHIIFHNTVATTEQIQSNGCNTRKNLNNQQGDSDDLFEPEDTCCITFMRIFNVRNDHNKYGSGLCFNKND